MLLFGLVRGLFGRALEVMIILDRAQYLAEAGAEVKVWEFFNSGISPRNLAIEAVIPK